MLWTYTVYTMTPAMKTDSINKGELLQGGGWEYWSLCIILVTIILLPRGPTNIIPKFQEQWFSGHKCRMAQRTSIPGTAHWVQLWTRRWISSDFPWRTSCVQQTARHAAVTLMLSSDRHRSGCSVSMHIHTQPHQHACLEDSSVWATMSVHQPSSSGCCWQGACSNGGKEENGTSSEYPFLGEKTSYGSEVELRAKGGADASLTDKLPDGCLFRQLRWADRGTRLKPGINGL